MITVAAAAAANTLDISVQSDQKDALIVFSLL
jgi:hypothetical protein